MPFRYARAGARSGPSVSARLRCLGSRLAIGGGTVAGGGGRSARRPWPGSGGPFAGASHPTALPLRESPQVALDLVGIELAAREVHVGGRDQPAFVGGERHPLGEG